MSLVDEAQDRHARHLVEAWSAVLAEPQGRAVVWSILEMTAPFQSTFATDPSTAAFAEGRRSVGLEILAHHLPGPTLAQLMTENAERLAEIERAIEEEQSDD